jgi:hypothetical protein
MLRWLSAIAGPERARRESTARVERFFISLPPCG